MREDTIGASFLHVVSLPFHETGHVIFSPFGDLMTSFGGSLAQVLQMLPKVSGSWGSGHLLRGTLFSALLTDDGRLVVGAVAPEALYAALD